MGAIGMCTAVDDDAEIDDVDDGDDCILSELMDPSSSPSSFFFP